MQQRLSNRISAKVLIADDDHIVLEALSATLEAGGFSVITIGTGDEAIYIARRWRPDILLSDVLMPGLNGIETAMRISTEIPECRVFLMSAHRWSSRQAQCYSSQEYGFEFVGKPLHPEDLIDRLWASLLD